MRVTVASFKGGVGKTTTAVHLAAFLNSKGKTLLVDGDPNRSVIAWNERGPGLPFTVVDEAQLTRHMVETVEHVVIDTQARPETDDLRALSEGCDLLVIPATPDILSLHALSLTVEELRDIGARYRVLLTICPPRPSRDAAEARESLHELKLPMFKTSIRRLSAFAKAALAGVLVNQIISDPRAQFGWEDYSHIGRELKR